MKELRSIRWIFLLILIPLVAGCPWSTKTDDGGGDDPIIVYKENTSPENLLFNFGQAWEEKNIDEYLKLFSADYTFYFSQEDIDQHPEIPPTWGLEQDKEATRGLFEDTNVQTVELYWVLGDPEESPFSHADNKILVTNIYLTVFIFDPDDDDLWENIIQGEAEFHFRKLDETTAEGDTLWHIVVWKDLTAVQP